MNQEQAVAKAAEPIGSVEWEAPAITGIPLELNKWQKFSPLNAIAELFDPTSHFMTLDHRLSGRSGRPHDPLANSNRALFDLCQGTVIHCPQ